jgi:hypothetical protein
LILYTIWHRITSPFFKKRCGICRIIFSFICSILPGGDLSDALWGIQAITSILASWLLLPLILPFVLNVYLISETIKEAKTRSNPRLYFNPLVILAIILSIIGSITTHQTMLACF